MLLVDILLQVGRKYLSLKTLVTFHPFCAEAGMKRKQVFDQEIFSSSVSPNYLIPETGLSWLDFFWPHAYCLNFNQDALTKVHTLLVTAPPARQKLCGRAC